MKKIKIEIIEQLNNVVAHAEKLVTSENFENVSDFNLMKEGTARLLELTNELEKIAFPENNIKGNIVNLKNTLQQLRHKVVPDVMVEAETATDGVEATAIGEDTAKAVTVDAETGATNATAVAVEEAVATELSVATELPVVEMQFDEQPTLDFATSAATVSETSNAHENEVPAIPIATEASTAEAPIATVHEATSTAEAPAITANEATHVATAAPTPTEAPASPNLIDRLRSLSEEGKSEKTSTLRSMISKLRDVPSMPEVHLERPIDLRTSVGINEKFLFVNELFGGSIRECNEAMALLNDLDNIDRAMEQVHSYKEKFSWNEESVAYMTFVEVVSQRFSQMVFA
ncbi:MAG: hypothetical protein LBQ31_02420 [Bacteroidales bacterium]|nr:hypothetical protein [Bacteroidales bacterium]